jgi:hypothetical protein
MVKWKETCWVAIGTQRALAARGQRVQPGEGDPEEAPASAVRQGRVQTSDRARGFRPEERRVRLVSRGAGFPAQDGRAVDGRACRTRVIRCRMSVGRTTTRTTIRAAEAILEIREIQASPRGQSRSVRLRIVRNPSVM